MREIKFRAIPIDEFDAVVGQDCGHGDGTFIFGWGAEENPDGTALLMRDDNDGIIVKADTVGQYTCMHDCNGKEIYEGDIILDNSYGSDVGRLIGVVVWCNNLGGWAWNSDDALIAESLDTIQVIGNHWDNPELLGGDAK